MEPEEELQQAVAIQKAAEDFIECIDRFSASVSSELEEIRAELAAIKNAARRLL